MFTFYCYQSYTQRLRGKTSYVISINIRNLRTPRVIIDLYIPRVTHQRKNAFEIYCPLARVENKNRHFIIKLCQHSFERLKI